jgi:hypothetical protein
MSQEYIDINLSGTGIDDNIIVNDLQLFFQEVQMAVTVGVNELWGVRDSVDLAKYLFNQYMTINAIQNELNQFISAYCSQAAVFPWSLDVQILKVDTKELIYIEMSITPNGADKSFLQKFLLGA